VNKMKDIPVREIIHTIVDRIEKDGGFSHLLINHEVKRHKLSDKDKRLLTNVVYGTIQHKLTLDYYLSSFIQAEKVDGWVLNLLRIAVYQMVYLDRIPNHAILYDSVEIAKKKGHKGIASFVNGVLRNIQRKGLVNLSDIKDETERLSVESSHPKWLISYWKRQYGEEITKGILTMNSQEKPQSLRIQPLRTNREKIIKYLEKHEIKANKSLLSSQGIIIENGNALETRLIEEGYVTIQDQSSMLVSEMMDLSKGMNVLDACSAPGGKATHIAELLENTGEVHAYDIHKNKIKLIKENAKRLGLTNITVKQSDARKLTEIYEEDTFDRILLDVPCSGLGVIRSKPDIKYTKTKSDINQLSKVQDDIIFSSSPLLKKGGKLIYSTCTIAIEENLDVIKNFIKKNEEFTVDQSFFEELPEGLKDSEGITDYGIQIFPQQFNTDGFFITRLVRQ